MVMSSKAPQPLRRVAGIGGSRPGKPQNSWPWVIKIIAEAVTIRSVGSLEAVTNGDRGFSSPGVTELEGFKKVMDATLPGWREWCLDNMKPTKETKEYLLRNRVYKSCKYVGSSAGMKTPVRGLPKENWRFHFTGDHPTHQLHDQVRRGTIVTLHDWKSHLDLESNI